MRKRLVLTMLVTVVLLLLIAPQAFAYSLTGISPGSGIAGTTVTCTVTGSFPTVNPSAPSVTLYDPVSAFAVYGDVQSWDPVAGGSVTVKFTLPAAAPEGSYSLRYVQYYGFALPQDYYYGEKLDAFSMRVPPHIDSCDPAFILAGSPDTLMFVHGSGFVPDLLFPITLFGSRVYWNGTMLTMTYSSASLLNATVPAAYLTTPGYNYVTVQNLADGTTSNSYEVAVTIPTPAIGYTEPTSIAAGSDAFSLNVSGSSFVPGAVVVFDGTDLTTEFISATKLHASVPASLVAAARSLDIVVRNGGAGAPVSSPSPFTVTTPVPGTPTITGVSPSSATAGGPQLDLEITGTGFVSGAIVYWNSTALYTTWGSTGRLVATVTTPLVATAGTFNLTVHNGGVGGLVSAPWPFTVTSVTPGTPSIVSLSPTSATAGGAAFPLIVNGSGFIASSVVVWAAGGTSTDLATAFNSATQLTAQVPASLIATAGTASVTVRNGGAGSPVSAALSFAITSGGGGGGGTFALSSLEPSQVYVGYVGPGILLTVNGSGFLSGAHIWLGTQEKTNTTFVSATKLTTMLLPAELASPGTIQVSVKNPPGVAGPSTLPLGVGTETTDPTVTIQGADSGWHNSPVTLTFVGNDPQSGVQKVQYRCPPAVGAWTTGTTYTVPATTQGEITVSAQVFDWCDRVGSASATVRIDTTRPKTDALNAVSVRRGKIARLKFRVSEPTGLSPTGDVTLQIKKGERVVWTKVLSSVPMNSTEQYSFRVSLKKGSYRWYVRATDLAGNTQVKADRAAFKVR